MYLCFGLFSCGCRASGYACMFTSTAFLSVNSLVNQIYISGQFSCKYLDSSLKVIVSLEQVFLSTKESVELEVMFFFA